MKLLVRPRLQVETWSLYWKEPMRTDTQCLPDVEVEAEAGEPLQAVLQRVAQQLGWAPVDKLLRLEGFAGARAAACGRRVLPTTGGGGHCRRRARLASATALQASGSARCTGGGSCRWAARPPSCAWPRARP
jgi:hypothetical protein